MTFFGPFQALSPSENSRYRDMNKADNHLNFSEILENTVQSESKITTENDFQTNMEWSSDIEPMHLSYLLGIVEIHTNLPISPMKNPYLKYIRTIQKPDYILTVKLEIAFELINRYLPASQKLLKNFNLTQLKRSYKKAALRAHPDCGGTHERFLQLKSSLEMLLAFLHAIK